MVIGKRRKERIERNKSNLFQEDFLFERSVLFLNWGRGYGCGQNFIFFDVKSPHIVIQRACLWTWVLLCVEKSRSLYTLFKINLHLKYVDWEIHTDAVLLGTRICCFEKCRIWFKKWKKFQLTNLIFTRVFSRQRFHSRSVHKMRDRLQRCRASAWWELRDCSWTTNVGFLERTIKYSQVRPIFPHGQKITAVELDTGRISCSNDLF